MAKDSVKSSDVLVGGDQGQAAEAHRAWQEQMLAERRAREIEMEVHRARSRAANHDTQKDG